jgi:hypothetical protein
LSPGALATEREKPGSHFGEGEAMFSSTVLDLATGMIFCFLTASLATGVVVEAIASVFKLRSKTLLSGVKQLLNDKDLSGLAGQLYNHALVNPRGPGDNPKKNAPAYIDRQLFGRAMMDVTGISLHFADARAVGSLPSPGALYDQISHAVSETQNPQIHAFLSGIIDRCANDADKIQAELSAWFDSSMDRVSGVYKRYAQLIGFVVALLLAGALNIDAVSVAKTLWMQPTVAEKIKADPNIPTATAAVQQLTAALPIGWPKGFGNLTNPNQVWGWAIVGWLITAFSTLFGAPFWFDLLQTVVRLKGSGPSPKEKADGTGASA